MTFENSTFETQTGPLSWSASYGVIDENVPKSEHVATWQNSAHCFVTIIRIKYHLSSIYNK